MQVAGALTLGSTYGRNVLAAVAPVSSSASPQRPAIGDRGGKQAPLMQIGILLGTFVRPSLEGRLDAAKAGGLDHVQLSLDCAGLPAMPEEIFGL